MKFGGVYYFLDNYKYPNFIAGIKIIQIQSFHTLGCKHGNGITVRDEWVAQQVGMEEWLDDVLFCTEKYKILTEDISKI